MRNYYYCEANGMIYTEAEKKKSDYAAGRFVEAGQHKSRKEAEKAWDDAHWFNECVSNGNRN